jgi:hypothetical protein
MLPCGKPVVSPGPYQISEVHCGPPPCIAVHFCTGAEEPAPLPRSMRSSVALAFAGPPTPCATAITCRQQENDSSSAKCSHKQFRSVAHGDRKKSPGRRAGALQLCCCLTFES